MEFFQQNWFWMGIFTVTGSLGGILIKEWITSRSQIKIERLKAYESDVFNAYNVLYKFIAQSYEWLWPPDNPQREFRALMKLFYYKSVKEHMIFYRPEIREILTTFENQYKGMNDQDLYPTKSFDDFYSDDFLNNLQSLEAYILQRTDSILHNQ